MAQADRRLDAAVSLGVISREQADAIRALGADSAHATLEAPRALNPVTLAYVLGALTVLVAMAWFLADRWEWLGADGALAVALLYAACFLVVARRLRREGFPQASGFAVLLAVMMTPVGVFAIDGLTGWFDGPRAAACGVRDFVFWTCRGREVVAELATAVAALIALRRVRFSPLVVPVIVVGLRMLFHAGDLLWRNAAWNATTGMVWVIGASVLTAIAYVTDRRQAGDEDYALWVHFGAAMSGGMASLTLLSVHEGLRHVLIPAALVAFFFSLRMRRLAWLVLGMAWFVGYLAWLAGDVFRDTPVFPIILAALGIGVIIAAVWVQRNSARLVARFGGVTGEAGPSFPGGVPLLLLPALVAALQLPASLELDRRLRDERDAAMRSRSATGRRLRAAESATPGAEEIRTGPRETSPPSRP